MLSSGARRLRGEGENSEGIARLASCLLPLSARSSVAHYTHPSLPFPYRPTTLPVSLDCTPLLLASALALSDLSLSHGCKFIHSFASSTV